MCNIPNKAHTHTATWVNYGWLVALGLPGLYRYTHISNILVYILVCFGYTPQRKLGLQKSWWFKAQNSWWASELGSPARGISSVWHVIACDSVVHPTLTTDPVKMNIQWYSWFMQFRFGARIHTVSRCPWELWGKPDGETIMDHVFGEEASTQQVTCCTCAEMETLQT
jgi:hypothetical protein